MSACPTFFRAACLEAQTNPKASYNQAAWTLMIHLGDLRPDDASLEDWTARVRSLGQLCARCLDGDVLAWFDRELPRCLALVSEGGRGAFLRGVYQAAEDDSLDVFAI